MNLISNKTNKENNSVYLDSTQIFASSEDQEVLNAFVRDIENATNSIEIYTFSMSSKKMIEALNKKAKKGVSVHLYIDSKKYSSQLKQSLDSKIIVYPITLNFNRVDDGHFHHKTLICDKEVLWMGSGNFTDSCFNDQFNFFSRVKSDKLARKVQAVLNHQSEEYILEEAVEGQKIEYWHLPATSDLASKESRQNVAGVQRIKDLMASAQKTLKIANAFFNYKTLANQVIEARKRGIEVTFFYHGAFPEYLDRPEFIEMLNSFRSLGIKCVRNKKLPFLHEKCMIIDDKTFLNGSANWSARAFKWNEESFLVINDLKTEQIKLIQNYWNQTCEVGQE